MKKLKLLSVRLKILIVVLLVFFVGVWWISGFVVGRKIALAQEVIIPIGSLINEDVVPEVADVAHPITGVLYTKREAKAWNNRVPLAVMIENDVRARPHSSLSKADVVYEALIESTVTRFMAVFLTNKSNKDLGPMRSAREYYMDWAMEYKPAYAHWGGNVGVRNRAKDLFGKRDLDQFDIGAPTFFRRSPWGVHSAYTTTEGLWKVASQRGVNKLAKIDSWSFKEDSPAKKPNASKITVGFDGAWDHIVDWKYNSKTNTYLRFNGGAAHKDKVYNKQISVKTVIVQYVKYYGYKIITGVGNRNFQTTGSNKVLIFRDGSVVSGTWKKKNQSSRTKFFDKKGKEIPLNRGQIWVEIVPADSSVTYK